MEDLQVTQAAAARIAGGEEVPVEEVMQALAPGSLQARRSANLILANAYSQAGKGEQALYCAERAWFLGHRAADLLTFLTRALPAAGRARDALDRLREAAVDAIDSGDPARACDVVLQYQFMASALGVPLHDPVFTPAFLALMARHRQPAKGRGARPLRVGYVFWGEEQRGNVLPPVPIEIARNHDRSRFEPYFFSCISREALASQHDTGPVWLAAIDEIGATFVGGTPAAGAYGYATMLAANLREYEIDVMIPIGQFGINFFLAALRPAPVIIGLDVGNPHGYSSAALDHVIVSLGGHRYTMEEECDASQVYGAYTAFTGFDHQAIDRTSLGIAPDEIVVMTSGSAAKFQNPALLDMLGQIAVEGVADKVRVVLIGPDWNGPVGAHFRQTLPEAIQARMVLTGYRTDFSSVIRIADIYLDSYPIGGGWAMYEALAAGIATIAYGEKLRGLFNKNVHFTPASTHCTGSGLVVSGEDVSFMKQRAKDLIAAPELRRSLAAKGPEVVRKLLNKEGFTRDVEAVIDAVYQRVLPPE